ncbi:MAG: hypothetical protein QGH23_06070 [Dehalococcoidia bacterium]|nr:hypothetical protein [Dehalococcoidia bacterium]
MPLDREATVHLYRQMVTIRRFEERASEEFQQGARFPEQSAQTLHLDGRF